VSDIDMEALQGQLDEQFPDGANIFRVVGTDFDAIGDEKPNVLTSWVQVLARRGGQAVRFFSPGMEREYVYLIDRVQDSPEGVQIFTRAGEEVNLLVTSRFEDDTHDMLCELRRTEWGPDQ
jgi:hypothetical protein